MPDARRQPGLQSKTLSPKICDPTNKNSPKAKKKKQLWFRGHTACTKHRKPAVLARLQPLPVAVPLIIYLSNGGREGIEAWVVGCFISFLGRY